MKHFYLLLTLATCSSCSFIAVRNDLSVIDPESGWREVAGGPVNDRFEYAAASGDTIAVSYRDEGEIAMFGPPFLPVIPVFIAVVIAQPEESGYVFPPDFHMDFRLRFADSVRPDLQRIQFVGDSEWMESRVQYWPEKAQYQPGLWYTIDEDMDALGRIDIMFDSISSVKRQYDVPPLRLRRGRSLTIYNRDFGHAGRVW